VSHAQRPARRKIFSHDSRFINSLFTGLPFTLSFAMDSATRAATSPD
jgi:hypothetical protein